MSEGALGVEGERLLNNKSVPLEQVFSLNSILIGVYNDNYVNTINMPCHMPPLLMALDLPNSTCRSLRDLYEDSRVTSD